MSRFNHVERERAIGMLHAGRRAAVVAGRAVVPLRALEEAWRTQTKKTLTTEVAIRPRLPYGGSSVMVWGGVKYRAYTDMYVIQNNFTARLYCNEIITSIAILFLSIQGHRTKFQPNNAHPHTATITMNLLNQQQVDVLH